MMRALIVDDNVQNRYLLRALLQGHGYAVDEAHDGVEALVKARAVKPDLMVSDLLMPVMDGYTLLRHWRSDEHLRTVPFIVYTATYTEPRDERLAMALGANAFIIKPAEPDALMTSIRDVVDKARRGTLAPPAAPSLDEHALLREHNEILIQKLEKKASELERANRDLRAEIAERQRTEAAVAHTNRLMRAVLEGTSDAVFVKDRDGRYLLVNQPAARFLGQPAEAIIGKDDSTLLAPADAALASSSDRLTMETDRVHSVEETLVTAGMPVTFQSIKAPYHDEHGNVIGVIGVARDVTERRRIEEALRLRDRAMQEVSQGILITDPGQPDDPIVYASAGVERITGYSPGELLGRNCRVLQGKNTDPDAVRQLRAAIAGGHGCTVELLNYRKDGTAFWNSLSLNPVRSEAGDLQYFVGVQSDVTDRRKLEDQLRQSQKMDAIGRLAGGVAHDFNNLLTIIFGAAEQILEMPDLDDDVRHSVSAIAGAGERAAALTRQLLGFSRQMMLQPRVLDLNAMARDTGKLLQRLIGEDIIFTSVLDPQLGRVKVDPGHLDQVLMNLAVNARDAMPRGGRLTLETTNVILSDDYAAAHPDCKPGPHVMLAMTDTGTGMAPDVQARIFEPFFTTKAPGKGTGLGLAMVFGIVQQSGGCIHVYSEPGLGTTFKIYFPAVSEQLTASTRAESKTGLRGTETILLVEDDEGVRQLALIGLQTHGYKVLMASDGSEALRLADTCSDPIDLVLTDVVMPGVSGPELADAVRQRFPAIKVLFMSGYTDDTVVRHGLLQASVSFIQKPYTPLELARRVREVLDERPRAGA